MKLHEYFKINAQSNIILGRISKCWWNL